MTDHIKTALDKARLRSSLGGTWRHSNDASYFIFCVGQDPLVIAAFLTWSFSEEIPVKPLIGKWNGATERSFIANMQHYKDIEIWLMKEEAILLLDNYDARDIPHATLLYRDGTKEPLGKLIPVDKTTALSCASWTYDPLSATYFVTAE